MDLTLPVFNLVPPKEPGIDSAPSLQEGGGSTQTFTTILQEANANSGEVAANVIKILAAAQDPGYMSNGAEQQAAMPEGILQAITVVLRTVLGKPALMNMGKSASLANTTNQEAVTSNETDTCSEDGDETQPVPPALIEQIVATVLTQLQAHIQKFIDQPNVEPNVDTNEGRPSSISSGDQLRDAVTTLVRKLLAQGLKIDTPAPSSVDELTPPLPVVIAEPLEAEGRKAEPVSCEPVQGGDVQVHAVHGSARAVMPSPELPKDNQSDEPIDEGSMWTDAAKPTNETSQPPARGGDTSHSREEGTKGRDRSPDPDVRQGEAIVRFEVKEVETNRSDRSSTASIRPSVPPSWQEFEQTPTHPSVNLEVSPPEVGRVRLHVALAGERVYASVITEHAGVRDYLLAEQPRLEGGLSARGLEMGGFQVAVEHQDAGERDKRQPPPSTPVVEPPSEERDMPRHRGIQVNVLSLFA